MSRFLIFFCLSAAFASAQEPRLGKGRPDLTMKRLAAVDRFAFGGVGFAGVISEGETDLKFILSQPSPAALASLVRLYADGNPQAKAYALAGVKKLSRRRYRELLAEARASMDQ